MVNESGGLLYLVVLPKAAARSFLSVAAILYALIIGMVKMIKAKMARRFVARKYFALPNRQTMRPARMQLKTHENSVIRMDTYQRKFVGARKRLLRV